MEDINKLKLSKAHINKQKNKKLQCSEYMNK